MFKQDDFKKVQEHVIEPMVRMYHPPSHLRADKQAFDEVIREYCRALSGLPAVALEKGWADVKAEHKTWNWPHFQAIKDACEKHRPVVHDVPKSAKKEHFHCLGHAETEHPNKAREILSSHNGQLALSLGVGRDLLTEYEVSGRQEFDDEFVQRMSRVHQENCKSMAKLPPGDAWLIMYESMMERERKLFTKFYLKSAA